MRNSKFKQALGELLSAAVDKKIGLLANELSEKEGLIYQQIVGSETENPPRLPVDEAFLGLREAANTLSRVVKAISTGNSAHYASNRNPVSKRF